MAQRLALEIESPSFSTDHDEEDEEFDTLLGTPQQRPHHRPTTATTLPQSHRRSRAFVIATVALALFSLLAGRNRQQVGSSTRRKKPCSDGTSVSILPGFVLHYACPCNPHPNPSSITGQDQVHYVKASEDILDDVPQFMKRFRHSDYDDWGRSYAHVKAGMYEWKDQFFGPYLVDNATVYESGSGIGLNLFMTLEILQETRNIQNLRVYGNDYVANSVAAATQIAEYLPGNGTLGQFCTSDSNDLGHVPPNSFDLVFTGYLSPLIDPLDLRSSRMTGQDLEFNSFGTYISYCNQKNNATAVGLSRKAQHLQNKWFANWYQEMIRIAKPGAPVIVEQVSPQLCQEPFEWGGVSRDFWRSTAENRGWNVDLESIQFYNDTIFSTRRYHVFMRKKRRHGP